MVGLCRQQSTFQTNYACNDVSPDLNNVYSVFYSHYLQGNTRSRCNGHRRHHFVSAARDTAEHTQPTRHCFPRRHTDRVFVPGQWQRVGVGMLRAGQLSVAGGGQGGVSHGRAGVQCVRLLGAELRSQGHSYAINSVTTIVRCCHSARLC